VPLSPDGMPASVGIGRAAHIDRAAGNRQNCLTPDMARLP
jgi:hypothetical protein